MPGINTDGTVFIFMVLSLWLIHMAFAAVSWNVIEAVVNPMLATTGGLSVLGAFFLFAGFFILQEDLVPAIRWIPYTIPTMYSLRGIEYAYFHGVDYTAAGANGTTFTVTGDEIIDT